MSSRRYPGTIIDNTIMIDIGLYGIDGAGAIYLIQDEMKCLIDAGSRRSAPRLVKILKRLKAFPPDLVILTHAHFDHTQGIPHMRKEAAKMKKGFDVLASPKTIPLLLDESYNQYFDQGPYQAIDSIIPINPGDRISLGSVTLRAYELPGHASDHIGLLDEKNGNFFVGDAIGNKISDGLFLPPFMPPAWDPDAFLSTVEKLKRIDYQSLSLGHYGYIYGDEARDILDETVANLKLWWDVFETSQDRLDDTEYMLEMVKSTINPSIPQIRLLSRVNRMLLGLVNIPRNVLGIGPINLADKMLVQIIQQLAAGYRVYKNSLKNG